ncbi:unnamed protein product [Urochloa humidicola]
MARPHVVVVPYPGSGNINPALQLANLLRRHGVFITFVITEHNLRRVQAAADREEGAASALLQNKDIVTPSCNTSINVL